MPEEQTQIKDVPPIEKRSMVSENLDIKAAADSVRKEMEKPDFMPNTDTLLLFAVEKLHDIAVATSKIAEVVDIFKKANMATQVAPVQAKPVIPPVATPFKAVPVETPTDAHSVGDFIKTNYRIQKGLHSGFSFSTIPTMVAVFHKNENDAFVFSLHSRYIHQPVTTGGRSNSRRYALGKPCF